MKDFNYNLIGMKDAELEIYLVLMSIILYEDQTNSLAPEFITKDSLNAFSTKLNKVSAQIKSKIGTLLSLANNKLGRKGKPIVKISEEYEINLIPNV